MKKKKVPIWIIAFGLNFLVAFLAIIPAIIRGHGYLVMSHDYAAEQIAYNTLLVEAIKSGDFFWNWSIDIGSNFLESFAFYNLGSIFTWLLCLVPVSAVPKAMGWMLMLKFACAGATASAFLKRHLDKPLPILIASMLYAFSGFQCVTVVFYHFQDAAVFFPLLLIGLEKLVEEKKHGRLALACAINALCNYVFFVSEVIFLILYYIVRYLWPSLSKCYEKGENRSTSYEYGDNSSIGYQKREKFGKKKGIGFGIKLNISGIVDLLRPIGCCMLEGILGCMMSGILLIPSIMGTLHNSRVSNTMERPNWFTITTSDLLLTIKAFFFPAEAMSHYSAVTRTTWMSNEIYLPLFGATFVIAYMLSKKDGLSRFYKVCLVILMIPIFNGVFMMFNSEIYRRWYYMLALFMALGSVRVLEDLQAYKWKAAIGISAGILGFYFLMTGYPFGSVDWSQSSAGNGQNMIFIPSLYLKNGLIAVLSLGLLTLLTACCHKYRRILFLGFTAVLSAFLLHSTIHQYDRIIDNTAIDFRSFDQSYAESVISYLTEIPEELDSDVLPYRYCIDEGLGYTYYNLAMMGRLPSIGSFISTVNSSVIDYYASIGSERNTWTNDLDNGNRELLGARYILTTKEQPQYQLIRDYTNSNGQVMHLYENDAALPVGFAYDTYMLRSQYDRYENKYKQLIMLSTMVIDDKDEELVASVLSPYDKEVSGDWPVFTPTADNPTQVTFNHDPIDREPILAAAEQRKQECSTDFQVTDNAFSFRIAVENPRVVLMSVPYSEYWSATVNGEPADVINSNGLMAVIVPAGENEIRMNYVYTPMKYAVLCTVLGILLWGGYVMVCKRYCGRKETLG